MAAITSSMVDARLEVQDMIVEGDRAAAHWTMSWTQRGDFLGGLPADGCSINLRGHDFYRFDGDRIAELWHCEDLLAVLVQLGVVTMPA